MSDPYSGLPSLNAAYAKDPVMGKAIVDRYRKLMSIGANKSVIEREAKNLGFAPIIEYGDGTRRDMTEYLSQEAPRSFGEGVQDVAAGVGRGFLSLAPDLVSLAGLGARAVGIDSVSEYGVKLREGINEFLPMSNEYRNAKRAKSIFDLNPGQIGQGGGSILGMALGGTVLKTAAKGAAAVTGGKVGASLAKAPVFGSAGSTLSPSVRAGIAMGAGSEAEAAYQAKATPFQSAIAAVGGATGGYLEKFGTERLLSKIFSGKTVAYGLTKDATGKYILPKAADLPGFGRVFGVSQVAETAEEQAAALIADVTRSAYEKEPFLDRAIQSQRDTLATAPYSIGPLSAYAGVRAAAFKGRLAAAERAFPERVKSIFNMDGVGSKPIARDYVSPDAVSAEDQAVLDAMGAPSGVRLLVSSASHDGLNEMARRVSDSGTRVVFVGRDPSTTPEEIEASKDKPLAAGTYNAANNTLYINGDIPPEQQVVFGLVHEMVHRLAKSDPTGMQGVFDRVASVFGKKFTDYSEALQARYKTAGIMDPATLTEEGFANFLTHAMHGYIQAALTDEADMRMLAVQDFGLFSDIASVFGGWAKSLTGRSPNAGFDRQIAQRLSSAVESLNMSVGAVGADGMEVTPEVVMKDFQFAREFIESMQKMLGDKGLRMEQVRRETADILSKEGAESEAALLGELASRLGVDINEAEALYNQSMESYDSGRMPLTAEQIAAARDAKTAATAKEAADLATAEETAAAKAAAEAEAEAEKVRDVGRAELVNALVLANRLASKLGVEPTDLLEGNIRSLNTIDGERLNLLAKSGQLTEAEVAGLQAARNAWSRSAEELRQGDELTRQQASAEALEKFDRTRIEERIRRSKRTPMEVLEDTAKEKAEEEKVKAAEKLAKEQAAEKRKQDAEKAAADEKAAREAAAKQRAADAKKRQEDREAEAEAKKNLSEQAKEQRKVTQQQEAEKRRAKAKLDSLKQKLVTAERRLAAATTANNTAKLPDLQTAVNDLTAQVEDAQKKYDAIGTQEVKAPEAEKKSAVAKVLLDLADPAITSDEKLKEFVMNDSEFNAALQSIPENLWRNVITVHANNLQRGADPMFSLIFNATINTQLVDDVNDLRAAGKIMMANKVVDRWVSNFIGKISRSGRRNIRMKSAQHGYGIYKGDVEDSMSISVDINPSTDKAELERVRSTMNAVYGHIFKQFGIFEVYGEYGLEPTTVEYGQPVPDMDGYYARSESAILGKVYSRAEAIGSKANELGISGLSVNSDGIISYTTSYDTDANPEVALSEKMDNLYDWLVAEEKKLYVQRRGRIRDRRARQYFSTGELPFARRDRKIALRENVSEAGPQQVAYSDDSIRDWLRPNEAKFKEDLNRDLGIKFSLLVPEGQTRSSYVPVNKEARAFDSIQKVINAAFDGPRPQFEKNPTKTSKLLGGRTRTIAQFFRGLLADSDVIDYRDAYPGSDANKKPEAAKLAELVGRATDRMYSVSLHAIHEYPNWTAWYKDRLDMAMKIFADMDPRAARAEDQFILKALLAITSNGQKVDQNTAHTWRVYKKWLAAKETGRKAKLNNQGGTAARDAITKHLIMLDSMIEERGWQAVSDLFDKTGMRKDLISTLKSEFPSTFPSNFNESRSEWHLSRGEFNATEAASGELVDEYVPFASLFGPKLGSFYNNLNGKFDTTTMDRWFMRTFGRTMGTQLSDASDAKISAVNRFSQAIDSLSKEDLDLLLDAVKLTRDASVEDMAAAISKYMGVQKSFRLNWASKGTARDNVRLAANNLAKVADGAVLVEAPENGAHRRFIRTVINNVVGRLKEQHGYETSPAELQALLWYYEKELHNEWQSGETDSPDYASAANKLFVALSSSKDGRRLGLLSGNAPSFVESGLQSRRDAGRPVYIAERKAAADERKAKALKAEQARIAAKRKLVRSISEQRKQIAEAEELYLQSISNKDDVSAEIYLKEAAVAAGISSSVRKIQVVESMTIEDVDRIISGVPVLQLYEYDGSGQVVPLTERFAPRSQVTAFMKQVYLKDGKPSLMRAGLITDAEELAYSTAASLGDMSRAERIAQTVLQRLGVTFDAGKLILDESNNIVPLDQLARRYKEVSKAAKKANELLATSGSQELKFSLLTPEQVRLNSEYENAVYSNDYVKAESLLLAAAKAAGYTVSMSDAVRKITGINEDDPFFHGTALGRFLGIAPKLKSMIGPLQERKADLSQAVNQELASEREAVGFGNRELRRLELTQVRLGDEENRLYTEYYRALQRGDAKKADELKQKRREVAREYTRLGTAIDSIRRNYYGSKPDGSRSNRLNAYKRDLDEANLDLFAAERMLAMTSPEGVDAFSNRMLGQSNDNGYFGTGFYFTNKFAYAEDYSRSTLFSVPAGYKKERYVYKVALSVSNPYYAGSLRQFNSEDLLDGKGGGYGDVIDSRDSQKLLENGYDGLVVMDEGGPEVVVFSNSQIKSLAVGEVDNNGKLIPLSERFNRSNPDLRYSLLQPAWFKSGIAASNPLDFTGVDDPSMGWFVKQFADYMQPVRAVTKSIERVAKESGGKLAQWSESMDVSARLDMYRNLTSEYMNEGKVFIDEVSSSMAEGKIPLTREAGDAAGNTNVSVDEYLIAKHAERRNAVLLQDILNKDTAYSRAVAAGDTARADARKAKIIQNNANRRASQKARGVPQEADYTMLSGMSDSDARSILARAKNPAYAKISESTRKFQKRKLQMAVMTGLISKEQADAWRRKYGEDYVPLKTTILDPNEQFLGGSGFVVRGAESKKATGRSTMADDIAGHMIVDYSAIVSRGMKNMVGQSFYLMAAANPNPAWTMYDSMDDVPTDSQSRVFSTKFNGEEKLMTINNAEMVRAMRNMDMADMGRGLAVAAAASRTFTKLQTAWSPAFILPNFVRDLGLALTITGVDKTTQAAIRVAKNIPAAVATIFNEQFGRAPGKLDAYYREMKQQGALTGYSTYYSVTEAAAALQSEAARLRDGESMPVSYLKKLAGFMEKLNAVAERATRLAVYAESRESGLSRLKAAEVAVNITVNFGRRGNATPVMNTLYPFFNANIQGTSNLARRMFWSDSATPRQKKRMTAAIAGISAMGYVFSAIARGVGGDDEEGEEAYKNVPEYDLTRNIVVMKGDGSGDRYLIPLPWGLNLGYFAGAQFERMMAGDEDLATSTGRLMKTSFESLSPINGATWTQTISPTLVDPIVQIAENRNFAGAKIMPDRNPFDKTPLPDSQLKFKTVNPAATWVAESMNYMTGGSERKEGLIDVSPESIEHLGKFMAGGAGSFAYGILSGSIKSVAGEEEMGTEELPGVGAVAGRFLTEEDPARKTKTEFYDNLRKFAVFREDLEDKETRAEARKSSLRSLDAYTTAVDKKLRDLRKRQLSATTPEQASRIEQQTLVIMRRYNQRYNRLEQ
jgi:hypothetical protein